MKASVKNLDRLSLVDRIAALYRHACPTLTSPPISRLRMWTQLSPHGRQQQVGLHQGASGKMTEKQSEVCGSRTSPHRLLGRRTVYACGNLQSSAISKNDFRGHIRQKLLGVDPLAVDARCGLSCVHIRSLEIGGDVSVGHACL